MVILQVSVSGNLFVIKITWLFASLLLLLGTYLLIYMFLLNEWKAGIIFSILCFIWALTNCWVLQLHGSVFTFVELLNIRTAIDVIDEVAWNNTRAIICSVIFLVALSMNLVLCAWQKRIAPNGCFINEKKKISSRFFLMVCCSCIYVGLY